MAESGSGKPARKAPREVFRPNAPPKRERKAKPAAESPTPPAESPAPSVVTNLDKRLEAAVRRHFALVDKRDQTQAGLHAVALAHAEVWRLRADILHEQDPPAVDAARKASSTANELEHLAAKLERDSLADRVAELERRLSTTRKAGAKLADLDD